MCIYKKLNKLRMEFLSRDVKKTGHNDYSNYDYFELEDILPVAVPLCNEIGLTTITSFKRNELGVYGTMRVVDIEATDKFIEIESASGMAALKACHDIQNVGAVETYHRRYLWTALLELTEHDAMEENTESGEGEKGKKKKITAPPIVKTELPSAKKEEPKHEAPAEKVEKKEDPAKNYHIHFIKELTKTGQLKDCINAIRKDFGGRETTQLTVAEMKQGLANIQAIFTDIKFEI